jgi:hypothetical protein
MVEVDDIYNLYVHLVANYLESIKIEKGLTFLIEEIKNIWNVLKNIS